MRGRVLYAVLISALFLAGCKGVPQEPERLENQEPKEPLGVYNSALPPPLDNISYEFYEDGTVVCRVRAMVSRSRPDLEGVSETTGRWRVDGETIVVEHNPREAQGLSRSSYTFERDGENLIRMDGMPLEKQ